MPIDQKKREELRELSERSTSSSMRLGASVGPHPGGGASPEVAAAIGDGRNALRALPVLLAEVERLERELAAAREGSGVVVTDGVDVRSVIAGNHGVAVLLQIRGGATVRVPCEPDAARQLWAAKASPLPPRWKLVLVREA
jgi:hypothetical protein